MLGPKAETETPKHFDDLFRPPVAICLYEHVQQMLPWKFRYPLFLNSVA